MFSPLWLVALSSPCWCHNGHKDKSLSCQLTFVCLYHSYLEHPAGPPSCTVSLELPGMFADARPHMSNGAHAAAVLLGPLQSCTFLLNQGLLAATLGAFWSAQAHWAISVPAAALVRVTGTLAYIVLSSWTMNENLFALLLSNVYALLVSSTSLPLFPLLPPCTGLHPQPAWSPWSGCGASSTSAAWSMCWLDMHRHCPVWRLDRCVIIHLAVINWNTTLSQTEAEAWSMQTLQDQFNAFIGASGAPPPTVVIVVIGSMLTVNASLYTFLMHIVYAVLLRSMGYTITSIPKPVERLIFRQQVA